MDNRELTEISGNNLVAQANTLIHARYKITKNEELLLKAMMSLIEPKDDEFLPFSASISNLAELFGMDKNSAAREFDKVTTRLMSRVIRIETETGWRKFHWVSEASLKDGIVSLQFHDGLKKYLLALHKTGFFTQYRLKNILWFKSAYTSRIYELLVEAHNKKQRYIIYPLIDFRERMLGEGSKSYPEYKNFRKYVLDVAKKELSEKDEKGNFRSKFNFELRTTRTGRKITGLEFSIIIQKTSPKPEIKIDSNGRVYTQEEPSGDSSLPSPSYSILKAFGISEEKALGFSKKYDLEYIQEKIKLYGKIAENEEIKNPSGWLVKAIEQDFQDGEEVKKKQEAQKQKERREKERKEAEEKARKEAESKREQMAGKKVRAAFLSTLSEEEEEELLERVKTENPEVIAIIKSLHSGIGDAYLSRYIPNYSDQVTKAKKEIEEQEK